MADGVHRTNVSVPSELWERFCNVTEKGERTKVIVMLLEGYVRKKER